MANQNDLWAVSVMAQKFVRGVFVHHAAFVVTGLTYAHAWEAANRVTLAAYPEALGWQGHDIVITPCGVPVDHNDPASLRRLFDVPT